MKTLLFILNIQLGMDCAFCTHDDFVYFDVELEDADADKIEAAVEGKESLPQPEIEKLFPEAAEKIDKEARIALLDACVVFGWEDYGLDAISKDLYDLFEADLKSGKFSFSPEGAENMDEQEIYQAQYDAWEEAETQKMDAMSMHERSEYLQEHYGLHCDVSDTEYYYEYYNVNYDIFIN